MTTKIKTIKNIKLIKKIPQNYNIILLSEQELINKEELEEAQI